METSEKIDQIMPALIAARGEFSAAVKDGKNPHFRSKYATLESAIDAVAGAFASHGLIMMQPTDVVDGRVMLRTRIYHESGQWVGSTYPVHPVKKDPQGEGSALTYARRYALMSLVGIAPEDDDGNAATSSVRATAKASDKEENDAWIARAKALPDDADVAAFKRDVVAAYGGTSKMPKYVIDALAEALAGRV